jgi:hypothetical protein
VPGVEPCRERGRAGQVAEHHRELAALGGVKSAWRGRGGSNLHGGCVALDAFEVCNRTKQLAAMSEQDAELFRILIGQIGKDAEINPVVIEDLGVLAKTNPGKPLSDLLHRSPLENASSFSKPMRDCTRGEYFWPPIDMAVLKVGRVFRAYGKKENIANGDEPRPIPEIATCPGGKCPSDKLSLLVPLQQSTRIWSWHMRAVAD